MSPEVLCEHVQQAIEKSLKHESWIDESILNIRGFSTGVQRRLISNICHMPMANPVYAEAGLFGGATFCSAINNNPDLTAFGIEDFSQDFNDAKIREHLDSNIEEYRVDAREVVIINQDFFNMPLSLITKSVTVFNYDAVHSFSAQRDALPFFFAALDDLFVYIVDDFAWVPVREGVRDGLKMLDGKLRVEREWMLEGEKKQEDPVWHNGVFVAVISKTK